MLIGLTGSFGSGKTAVARIFKRLGARVIDADRLAHNAIKPGSEIYKKIIAYFGRGILKKNRVIDRAKLGKIVFNNRRMLKALNNIVHPEVIRIINGQVKTSPNKIVILDAPLLIEAGLRRDIDKLIVVGVTRSKQLTRLGRKYPRLSRQDILSRINAQAPLSDKVRMADFVIDNSGTLKKTERQVLAIWKKLHLRKCVLC